MASVYNIGDLVWAKMKGFSPWPARVVEPTKDVKRPSLKKAMHCVFFFGTDNYAWVQEEFIKPYYKYKEQYMKTSKKSGSFKEALEAIDDYVRTRPKSLSGLDGEDPFLRSSPTPSDNTSVGLSEKPPVAPTLIKKKKIIKKIHRDGVPKVPSKRASTDSSSVSSVASKKRIRALEKSTSAATGNGSVLHTNSVSPTSWPSTSSAAVNSLQPKSSSLLSRPPFVSRPITPPLNIAEMSEVLRGKNVVASALKFGFLGLGIMGRGIVKNLLNSGHHVTVWNRTPSKCRDFVKAGAQKAQTPADVVSASDVTFCCVADPFAAKEMVFGNCGILQEMGHNKGLVEMTSIDHATSQDICDAILARGGRYLEAPVSGSKEAAEEGTLIILAAGDRSLFNDCETCFQAMGNQAFYLGDVGNGCRLNLIISLLLGTTLASLAEAMALAERAGLSQKTLVDILELGDLNCPAIIQKGKAILKNSYDTNMPLQHIQKDLRLALSMGDQLEQQLPLAAAACEVFKHAKRMGYGDHDVSAVYLRARF